MQADPLSGQVALVSGAGRGAGRRIAETLAAAGARIAVNDINPDGAAETVRRIAAQGGQAGEYVTDVCRKFAVQALFNQIEDEWGRLDLLVNNARVAPRAALLDMDVWDWQRTLDVNLTSVFLMTQVGGRLMRQAGGGLIVNLCRPVDPQLAAGMAAYAATQAAVQTFSEAASRELAAAGIRVLSLNCATASQEHPPEQIAAAVLQAAIANP